MQPKTLKQQLKSKLTKKQLELLPSSFDIVGDILIFADFPEELKKKEKIIGQEILNMFRNVNVVCKKIVKYSGKYRLPKLRIIAGQRRKSTEYKENNVRIKLHVEKCYFSSRLSTERKRITELVEPGEEILVMFSGVAPYPLVLSKNTAAKEIYGIEINPAAFKFALQNVILNKRKNIKLFLGDVRNILPKLNKKFDRILMPLPKGAEDYLSIALSAAKNGATIHFYDFEHKEEFNLAKEKVKKACKAEKKKCKILGLVKCGQYAPRAFRVCVDFKVL